MAASLPQEIINAIIDNLSGPSAHRSSLISCAFVSHSFRNPARRHMFSTISIRWNQNRGVEAYISQLLSLIDASPELRGLIKSLDLLHSTNPSSRQRSGEKPFVSLVMDDASGLYKLIRRLYVEPSALSSLSIRCFRSTSSGVISWKSFGVMTRLALYNLIPQLRSLHFGATIDVPVDILIDVPLLETLQLTNSKVAFADGGTDGNLAYTLKLDSVQWLRVDDTPTFRLLAAIALKTQMFPKVRRIQTRISSSADVQTLWDLLRARESLEELELHMYTNCSYLSESPIDLGQVPHLRSICIRLIPVRLMPACHSLAFKMFYPNTHTTSLTRIKVVFFGSCVLSSQAGFLPDEIDDSWAGLHPTKLQEVHPNLGSVEVGVDLSQAAVKWSYSPDIQAPSKAQILASLKRRLHRSIFGSENEPESHGILSFDLKAPNCLL